MTECEYVFGPNDSGFIDYHKKILEIMFAKDQVQGLKTSHRLSIITICSVQSTQSSWNFSSRL
jgi:hypothetical protein